MKTVIALFDAPLPARRVVGQLLSNGLGTWEVMTVPELQPRFAPEPAQVGPEFAAQAAPTSPECETNTDEAELLDTLHRAGVPRHEALAYVEGVQRGGILLAVRAPELTVPLVQRLIEAAAPPDLDTHRARWATRPELRYVWRTVPPPTLDPP